MFELPPEPPRKTPKARYIKPDSVKQLENDLLEQKKLKYPGQPYLCKKSLRDDTANGLTACIQCWCSVNLAHFQRVNTTGQYDYKLGRYRRSGSTKGVADIMIVHDGKVFNIEVKIGRDKQSKDQIKMQESIEQAGGIYMIIRNYDDFLEQIKKYQKKLPNNLLI